MPKPTEAAAISGEGAFGWCASLWVVGIAWDFTGAEVSNPSFGQSFRMSRGNMIFKKSGCIRSGAASLLCFPGVVRESQALKPYPKPLSYMLTRKPYSLNPASIVRGNANSLGSGITPLMLAAPGSPGRVRVSGVESEEAFPPKPQSLLSLSYHLLFGVCAPVVSKPVMMESRRNSRFWASLVRRFQEIQACWQSVLRTTALGERRRRGERRRARQLLGLLFQR